MKNLLFLSILSLVGLQANAQKIRFTDTTNRWTTNWNAYTPHMNPLKNTYIYSYKGTVQLNNHTYLILSAPCKPYYFPHNDSALIREDTASGKVFAITEEYPTEFVLYDYNLQVGDTFSSPYLGSTRIVQSIDSTLINNTWHKVFSFKWTNPGTPRTDVNYKVIEGIGTDATPLHAICGDYRSSFGNFVQNFDLICFSTQGTTPTLSPKVHELDNINSCVLDINKLTAEEEPAIYPQPARDRIEIDLPERSRYSAITIYDGVGRLLFIEAYQDKQRISIHNLSLASGVYYYRLNCDDNNYTGKLVFE